MDNIKLKVIIDNKEALETLINTDAGLQSLQRNADSTTKALSANEKTRIESINNEFERQRALADYELSLMEEKFLFAEMTEQEITLHREKHKNARERIAEAEAKAELDTKLESLNLISGMFNQQTAIAKAASIARAIISTYEGAAAALSPPPVGAGPLFGPILAGLTIASGMLQVSKIASVETPNLKGYAKGGIVVGEDGPEVIAPFQDYASGQTKLITQTVMAVEQSLARGAYSVGSSSQLSNEMKEIKGLLKEYLKNPVTPVISKKAIEKIYKYGGAEARRGRG